MDARAPEAWRVVGGIPLATRAVRMLELLGVRDVLVVTAGAPDPGAAGARDAATRLRWAVQPPGTPLEKLDMPEGVEAVAVDATLVADRRLLAWLVAHPGPRVVEPVPASTRPGRVRLARLPAGALPRLGGPLAEAPEPRLDPAALPVHSPEMRGPVPILLRDASTPEAARRAEDALVRDTQKHVMDAPARWVDPWVEDALVRRLAPTPITPNQITVAALVLGLATAWLLWQGVLGPALAGMLLVGWLDGVDGKLARLRLHYSRMGAGESYFDFVYENAWWLALAAWLAGAGHGAAAGWLGAALLAGNLLDEVAYTLADAWLGRSLDLLTPADGAFRLVAGRRNIYVYALLACALAGSPFAGLAACAGWAVLTGLVHAARLALAVRGVGAPAEPARVGEAPA